jgi:hypothetical protein
MIDRRICWAMFAQHVRDKQISRVPHSVFHARAAFDGMCTDGSSILQDDLAQRLRISSVFQAVRRVRSDTRSSGSRHPSAM